MREAGFTLVEMLAVIAIVALVAAIALPRLPQAATRPRLEAYAIETAARLQADRVAAVGGRLTSSEVEIGGRGAEDRVTLRAELTIGQSDIQRLLFDLETGRPYLFVETFEAQAPENGDCDQDMGVALTRSGWREESK